MVSLLKRQENHHLQKRRLNPILLHNILRLPDYLWRFCSLLISVSFLFLLLCCFLVFFFAFVSFWQNLHVPSNISHYLVVSWEYFDVTDVILLHRKFCQEFTLQSFGVQNLEVVIGTLTRWSLRCSFLKSHNNPSSGLINDTRGDPVTETSPAIMQKHTHNIFSCNVEDLHCIFKYNPNIKFCNANSERIWVL